MKEIMLHIIMYWIITKYDNPELKDNKTGIKKSTNKSKWCIKKCYE